MHFDHLRLNLKREQMLEERYEEIDRHNRTLAEKACEQLWEVFTLGVRSGCFRVFQSVLNIVSGVLELGNAGVCAWPCVFPLQVAGIRTVLRLERENLNPKKIVNSSNKTSHTCSLSETAMRM